MLAAGCFITGTDTGVGKSYVAALLVKGRRQRHLDCVGMKPICCGDRSDATLLHAVSDAALTLNDVNPIWLRTPAAPYAAAMIEERAIDIALIEETFARTRRTHASVIVEGVGGWLVPIARDYYVRDLAAGIGLPIVVVAANRLGALNHILLTIEAIRASGQLCAGIILNTPAISIRDTPEIATTTNRAVLESLVDIPVICEVAHGQSELTAPF